MLDTGDLLIPCQQLVEERVLYVCTISLLEYDIHIFLVLLQLVLTHFHTDIPQNVFFVLLVVLEILLDDWFNFCTVECLEVAVLCFFHTAISDEAVASIGNDQWIHLCRLVTLHIQRILKSAFIPCLFSFIFRRKNFFDVAVQINFGSWWNGGLRARWVVLHFSLSVLFVLSYPNHLVTVLEALLYLFLGGSPSNVEWHIEVGDPSESTELSK